MLAWNTFWICFVFAPPCLKTMDTDGGVVPLSLMCLRAGQT